MTIPLREALRCAGLAMMCVMVGCGGNAASDASFASAALAAPDAQTDPRIALPTSPAAATTSETPVRMKPLVLPTALKPAGPSASTDESNVQLQLASPDGTQASSLELPSVRGVGYPPVRARILSVRSNGDVPVASLRAQCRSTNECAFRVPLRDGTERLYVLRIPEDAVARLTPGEADGEVLVIARQMAMEVRTTVPLTLEAGRHAGSARIAYLGADAVQPGVAALPQPISLTPESSSGTGAPVSWAIDPPSRHYPFAPAR